MSKIVFAALLAASSLMSCDREDPAPSPTASAAPQESQEDVCAELRAKLNQGIRNGFSDGYLEPVRMALRRNNCP